MFFSINFLIYQGSSNVCKCGANVACSVTTDTCYIIIDIYYLGTSSICKCGANSACSGSTPHCKSDNSGTCVQCNVTGDCTGSSDTCFFKRL